MKVTNYKPHIFSLFALFVCGNAIITLPFYNAQNPFFALLTTAVMSILFVVLCIVIIRLAQKNRFAFFITMLVISAIAIYGAVITLYDYVRFVSQTQLPQASVIVLAITTVATVIFCAVCRDNAIYKYCLLTAVFCAAMVVLLFAGGIKHFDFSYLDFTFDKTDVVIDTPIAFLRLFSSLSAPVLFVFLTNHSSAKIILSGTVAGFCAVALCLAQSVLTLGITTDIKYPYLKAVSVISTGSLFTRLDGFVYFIFFVSAIVKIVVCIKVVILILKTLFITKTPCFK